MEKRIFAWGEAMKVLYIGCYRDGTGWANAAINYILSLDSAEIEVVPRFIKLNSRSGEVPKRIDELERKSDKNCDIVIQHILPHQLDYRGEFEKNISLYVAETDNCKGSAWPDRINLMDEAWVPNSHLAKDFCINSHIAKPHFVIPHACDISKYQKQYNKLEIPHLKNKFVFYYIGEITRRKNIGALMKAFHLEFEKNEDVALLVKGHIPGQSPDQAESHLREMSNKIKEGLKLYKQGSSYHQEVFICDYLTDEQVFDIHSTCDCFVSASFGEAWGIPIFDAMAMGKTPICSNNGGPADFLKSGGGILTDCRVEPCFGVFDSFDDLYTGRENWYSVDINLMRKNMREIFEDSEKRKSIASLGFNAAYDYSYMNVGKIMKNTIENNNTEIFNQNNEITKKHSIEKLIKCRA